MKKISVLLFFVLFIFTSFSYGQLQRNPVLEYFTGTWCQWCPCGHTVIKENIKPSFPNSIIVGYHGPASSSDPFRNFNGNSIITSFGVTSWPSGIVDRTSAPVGRGEWYNRVSTRNSINATVDFDILKTFNTTTRELQLTVNAKALTDLTGNYNITVIVTEDGLKYSQTGNSSCTGGSDYVHDNVVRSMLNGALGDLINTDGVWHANGEFQKVFTFTLPEGLNHNTSSLIILIYKQNSPLSMGEIQQAKEWTLLGDIVPVELAGFTASVEGRGILLSWETISEKNNHGFVVERSVDGESFVQAGFVKGYGTTTERQCYSFKDDPEYTGIFYYRLRQQDFDGSTNLSEVVTVKMDVPSDFILSQNYPNPFNPNTIISYAVPYETFVSLRVYDVMGREAAVLVNEVKSGGTYEISFNADDLPSGTYFYKLAAGNFNKTKKLLVLK
jgi:hypothetical protein